LLIERHLQPSMDVRDMPQQHVGGLNLLKL